MSLAHSNVYTASPSVSSPPPSPESSPSAGNTKGSSKSSPDYNFNTIKKVKELLS